MSTNFKVGDFVRNGRCGTGIVEAVREVYQVRFDIAGVRFATDIDLHASSNPPMDVTTAEKWRKNYGVLDGGSY